MSLWNLNKLYFIITNLDEKVHGYVGLDARKN